MAKNDSWHSGFSPWTGTNFSEAQAPYRKGDSLNTQTSVRDKGVNVE